MTRPRTITIAAAIVLDPQGRMLLVRKHGSPYFMQPGGKIEAGETSEAALRRELREEIAIEPDGVEPLGAFSAPAANEPDAMVVAHIFAAPTAAPPRVGAEIESLVWIDPRQPGDIALAPLTRDHMLSLAQRMITRAPGELR